MLDSDFLTSWNPGVVKYFDGYIRNLIIIIKVLLLLITFWENYVYEIQDYRIPCMKVVAISN